MILPNKENRPNFHKYSNKNWTKEEIDWLLKNANKGVYFVMKELNKTYRTVVNQAYRMRISLRPDNTQGGRMLGEANNSAPKLYQIKKPTIKAIRLSVLGRDGYKCHYCKIDLTIKTMTIDHKIPVSLGGKDHFNNYVASCMKCNYIKGNVCYQCPHLEVRLGVSNG